MIELKIKMRKLFNLLNDIYEDGTNDTQSLVAVTILGSSLAANPDLIDIAKEHFGVDEIFVDFVEIAEQSGAKVDKRVNRFYIWSIFRANLDIRIV